MDIGNDFRTFGEFALFVAGNHGFTLNDNWKFYTNNTRKPEMLIGELRAFDFIIIETNVNFLQMLIALTKLKAGGLLIVNSAYKRRDLITLGRTLKELFSFSTSVCRNKKYSIVSYIKKG